ncbi:uncharacterized protein LOC143301990 [Babylonia areolata]|uniref:uncharacterized protein LOC143301990 n=1 Tax=Babylonia areolata TaxID=304850 RepID=UPI003FCFCD52
MALGTRPMDAAEPFLLNSTIMQNRNGEKIGLSDFSNTRGSNMGMGLDYSAGKAASDDPYSDQQQQRNRKRKKGPPSWRDSWLEFTQNTTIHGLRFIWMEHAFLARKLLWLMLVSTCAGVMGYQIIDRIIYFYSFPVTVNVNVNFNKTLVFPSLTICNQNAFRATKATGLGRYRLLEAMFAGSENHNATFLENYNASDVTLDELYLSTSHSKYDLIVDCEWQSEKCGPENFTQILTDHGVCFTFNDDRLHPLLVASTGSEYGLKLTLNVEQYEYMPGPHDAAGIKLLLHDGKEYPGVAELGLAIPTGTHAYVGIQVVQIENLPKPHGDCASLSSPYYSDYSPDNCQLACLTDYVTQTCGCRHHHMPQKGGQPPICTLEQYYGCLLPQIGRLKERVRDECSCPIPCSFLIFDPAISFATTSVFATDRLLAAASRTNDLGTRYLDALEITNRMEAIKFNRFVRMDLEARERLSELSDIMLDKVRDVILQTESSLQGISNATLTAWNRKDHLYRWQEYHVRKNFMRVRDAMEERTFNYLTMGFQEYANLTESRIWTLADPNITTPAVRESLYKIVMTTLNAKMDLADRAFLNYTDLYSAYFNGTPVFRYKFLKEPRKDNVYITPKPLLKESLFHSSYATRYSNRVGDDILKFRAAVERFAELAMGAYENGTLDKDDMYYADVEFLWRGRRYLHSKSTFYFESIEYPLRIIQERLATFERMWRTYETAVRESLNNIVSLKSSLFDLENSILKRLHYSMLMARGYVIHGNVTKLEIAKELTSQNIYIGISDLKVFFQSLRLRGQKIFDNWDKIKMATASIWEAVVNDEDMLLYYEYKNMSAFLRNMSDIVQEMDDEFNDYRQRFDFRFLVGSADSLFLKSLQDLMADLENYLKVSNIETDFIRENFLQLDVFYREKSYEQITQQIAYDLFALLCDIGGSMGLFVGASVLSIGELLDLLFHQSIYRLTHRART